MSGIDWNGILRLPEAALAGCRRIPKTVLVKQAMLTKTEQKRLDKVARLEHFATVQKSTTRIPPYEDDERNVQSVVFLRCEMTAGTMAVAEVAELVHKCFPNPTVLLVEAGGCACISVALTRRSQAEQGATVVDRVESTGAFDPGRSEYADFLGALAFGRLSQGDLWEYLVDLSRTVALSLFPGLHHPEAGLLRQHLVRGLRGSHRHRRPAATHDHGHLLQGTLCKKRHQQFV